MKSLFILFLCLSFFGCSTTQVEKTVIPNNEVETIPEEEMISVVENNQQNINEQKVNIEIEQYKYYRINSPEGLRRREMPSLDSKVLGVYPDNYIVYVSEIGKELVEIDGISNYWVKIGHNNDPYTWVFGGYLKEIEPFPEDALDENEYRYTDFKTSYGDLTPSVFDENWESFYIFAKDFVGEPQQFALDCYDMFTSLTYDDYKIFTGLYKDKLGQTGYFIAKMDLAESKVLDIHIEKSSSQAIVFLKPWSSNSENLTVGRRFYTEAGYYVSINNLAETLYFDYD